MASALSRPLVLLGWALLLHAAYSTIHYKSLYSVLPAITQETVMMPPLDVYFEVLAGFLVLMTGSIMGMPCMLPVREVSESAMKTLDLSSSSQPFFMFNHRGKSLNRRKVQ